ncbi:CoA ester lyase [Pseudonocardia yunnanensis]
MDRIEDVDARTWLLVPGDHPDRFGTPAVREADALVLDLSSAVDDKERALYAVTRHLCGGGTAWVRVNGSDIDLSSESIRAVVAGPGLQGIILSRTESVDQVAVLKAQLRADVMIVALLETAAGIENAGRIAAAHGILRLAFGSSDLRHELGVMDEAAALLYARSRLVIASRAAGLPGPIDGPSVDLNDMVALGEDLRHVVGLGFTGKLCLHPRQLRMTNTAFAPPPSTLAWARRVLAATGGSDTPAVRVDGKVVDWETIEAARCIVARAALFDPTEARRESAEARARRAWSHQDGVSPKPTWRFES